MQKWSRMQPGATNRHCRPWHIRRREAHSEDVLHSRTVQRNDFGLWELDIVTCIKSAVDIHALLGAHVAAQEHA